MKERNLGHRRIQVPRLLEKEVEQLVSLLGFGGGTERGLITTQKKNKRGERKEKERGKRRKKARQRLKIWT